MQMNRPQSCDCTRCRMQMQNAECRVGPKATDALHPMQNAGCGCRMRNRARSCELHPTDELFGSDFASCILHPFWGRFCILHPAFCMLHIQSNHFGLGSAFCIMHLHSAFSEKYRMQNQSVYAEANPCRLQPACYKSGLHSRYNNEFASACISTTFISPPPPSRSL